MNFYAYGFLLLLYSYIHIESVYNETLHYGLKVYDLIVAEYDS